MGRYVDELERLIGVEGVVQRDQGGAPLRSVDWWVSVNDEPGTIWRGEKAIIAARECADEIDVGDFIYESTDGKGTWRFVAEDGQTFVVRRAPDWGPR